MTPTQIQLVQQTWAHVVPISEQAAELFYGQFFELDPAVSTLFQGDMKEQGKKLVTMIDAAVKGLNSLDKLVPALRELGKRLAGYGVTRAHYGTVGAVLLWTLEKGLGEAAFTPDVREAWTSVYGVLAGTMQTAALALKARNTPPPSFRTQAARR